MRLISVYGYYGAAPILYQLLEEREPHQNISHKEMPSYGEHLCFIAMKPYPAWYLLEDNGVMVGAIYLTHAREVGLFIFKAYQGRGYGKEALGLLRAAHPGRLLANVSLRNAPSMAFFVRNGFEMLQLTLELKEDAQCFQTESAAL